MMKKSNSRRTLNKGTMVGTFAVLTVIAWWNLGSTSSSSFRSSYPKQIPTHDSLWKYSAKDIDGQELSLSKFEGKVGLVFNAATH